MQKMKNMVKNKVLQFIEDKRRKIIVVTNSSAFPKN